MRVLLIVCLITLLVNESVAQKNTYKIHFSNQGSLDQVGPWEFSNGRKGKLIISASMQMNDSLLRAYYKPFIEKQYALIYKLESPALRDDLLTYYGFSEDDLKLVRDSALCRILSVPKFLLDELGIECADKPNELCAVAKIQPFTLNTWSYPINEKKNVFFSSTSTPIVSGQELTYNLEVASEPVERVNYKLLFNKPQGNYLIRTIKRNPKLLSGEAFEKFDAVKKVLESAKNKSTEVGKFIESIRREDDLAVHRKVLIQYRDALKSYRAQLEGYFLTQKDMVASWLWYTDGKPTLNPFKYIDQDKSIKDIQEKMKKLTWDSLSIVTNMNRAADLAGFYKDEVTSHLKEKPTLDQLSNPIMVNFGDLLGKLSVQSVAYTRLTHSLDSLRKELSQAKKKKAAFETERAEFQKKDILLYDGITFPGMSDCFVSPSHFVYQRNYDRLNKLTPLKNLPTSYDQSATVYLLVENETGKNHFESAVINVTDKSPITLALIDAVGQFTGTDFDAVRGKLAAFESARNDKQLKSGGFDDEVPVSADIYDIVHEIQLSIDRIKGYTDRLVGPPQLPYTFESDITPRFSTSFYRTQFPDTTRSSYLYKTTIQNTVKNEKGVVVTSTNDIQFRVNKLYRVLPSIGLAYSGASHAEVLLNPDGTRKETNYFNGASVMLGLKFYAFGAAPIYDSHFIYSPSRQPNFDFRKIHLMAGVNSGHPLQQFYLGAGIDLWSGVSINGGYHLISIKQQKLVGSVLESKSYLDWNNGYLSLNLDVSLALKLINIFAK